MLNHFWFFHNMQLMFDEILIKCLMLIRIKLALFWRAMSSSLLNVASLMVYCGEYIWMSIVSAVESSASIQSLNILATSLFSYACYDWAAACSLVLNLFCCDIGRLCISVIVSLITLCVCWSDVIESRCADRFVYTSLRIQGIWLNLEVLICVHNY